MELSTVLDGIFSMAFLVTASILIHFSGQKQNNRMYIDKPRLLAPLLARFFFNTTMTKYIHAVRGYCWAGINKISPASPNLLHVNKTTEA